MEDFPAAIFLASEESVFHNSAVLFDLVRPTKTGDGVESAAGLANVIPRKRIYRMETKEELEIFKNELLRRPLVLQPTTHSGKGLGKGTTGCALWVTHVNWILLINQTHPKILGRIQMGVDAAKKAMEKEEPFLLRYKFGSLLQRLHFLIFNDGLNMEDRVDQMLKHLRYANWTYGELIVRYPGSALKKNFLSPARDISFSFEDVVAQEILVRPVLPRAPIRPTNNPVTGDEIRTCLPGWTVNEITPLEEIGETAPANNYSYAQAGRLYESFRRKKKNRPGVDKKPKDNHGFESSIEMKDVTPSVSRDAGPPTPNGAYSYLPQNSSVHGASVNYIHPQSQSDSDYDDKHLKPNRHDNRYVREGQPQRPARQHEKQTMKSELYPEVHIVDKSSKSKPEDLYNKPDSNLTSGRESNQSSFSTAASSGPTDSGYHGNETDSYHSDRHYYENSYSLSKVQRENLGFHHEEESEDEIMKKHKEFVNNILHQNKSVNNNLPVRKPRDTQSRGYQKQLDQYQTHNKHAQNSPPGRQHDGYEKSPRDVRLHDSYEKSPRDVRLHDGYEKSHRDVRLHDHYDKGALDVRQPHHYDRSPRDVRQPDNYDRSPRDVRQPDHYDRSPRDLRQPDHYGNQPNNRQYENYNHRENNLNDQNNTQHFKLSENMSESFI